MRCHHPTQIILYKKVLRPNYKIEQQENTIYQQFGPLVEIPSPTPTEVRLQVKPFICSVRDSDSKDDLLPNPVKHMGNFQPLGFKNDLSYSFSCLQSRESMFSTNIYVSSDILSKLKLLYDHQCQCRSIFKSIKAIQDIEENLAFSEVLPLNIHETA